MSIGNLIDAELQRGKHPDPHVIARKVYGKMSPEDREAALLRALPSMVREHIRSNRNGTDYAQVDESQQQGTPRWKVSRPAYFVSGEWKFLDDCTVDDLRWLAEEYARQAATYRAKAREFKFMADELERSGARTYGEIRGVAA